MIIKKSEFKQSRSSMIRAGQKQEQDVAFFLRREFKDTPNIFIINDFKFTFNDETAQIDHLLLYPYGFILMESKSIKGKVKVNDFGEWRRSFNDQWTGMPSPIKQVELQQKLLRDMLLANRNKILGKVLWKQQGFEGRCWNNICVVSSNAIIERDTIPESITQQLVKSEFLVEKLKEIMNLSSDLKRMVDVFDSRPKFSMEELTKTSSFLMSLGDTVIQAVIETAPTLQASYSTQPAMAASTMNSRLKCKCCGEHGDFMPLSGRYGYYIKCNKCQVNTAMKMPCCYCQSSNAKVSKEGDAYFLNCEDCERAELLL